MFSLNERFLLERPLVVCYGIAWSPQIFEMWKQMLLFKIRYRIDNNHIIIHIINNFLKTMYIRGSLRQVDLSRGSRTQKLKNHWSV